MHVPPLCIAAHARSPCDTREPQSRPAFYRPSLIAGRTLADNWSEKAKRRKVQGTGRMRYMRTLSRRFKNGFRENVAAPPRNKTA
jgi:hypothetical protein